MSKKVLLMAFFCVINTVYCDDDNITFKHGQQTAIDSSIGLKWYLSAFNFSKKKSMPGMLDVYLNLVVRGEYAHYYNTFNGSFYDLDFYKTVMGKREFHKISKAMGGVGYATGLGMYKVNDGGIDTGIDLGLFAGFHKNLFATFEEKACNLKQKIALENEKLFGALVRTCNLYKGNYNIVLLNLLGIASLRNIAKKGRFLNRFIHNTKVRFSIPNTDGYSLDMDGQIGGIFQHDSVKKYHSFIKYLLKYKLFMPSISSYIALDSDIYIVFTGSDKNYFQQSVGMNIPFTHQNAIIGVNFQYSQPRKSYLFLQYTYDMSFDYNMRKVRIYTRGDYVIMENDYRIGFGVSFNF